MKEEKAIFDAQAVAAEAAESAASAETAVRRKKPINRAKLQENLWGWAFVALLVIGTTLFVYVAFILTVILSFTNYTGQRLFDYLGNMTSLNNDAFFWYKYMFRTQGDLPGIVNGGDIANFWGTLANSLFYLIGIPIGMVLSIGIAVCMSRDIKFTNTFRVIYYIPTVASVVSITLIWTRLFDSGGAINQIFGKEGFDWFGTNPTVQKITVLILTTWKGLGGSVILFVAGMNGVNASYHEAAEIDGANAWSIFWRITLPQLYPTIFYVLVTSVIGGMQIYVEPNLIYGAFDSPGAGVSVTPFVGYIMSVVSNNRYAYGCALSVILAIIIFIFTLVEFALDARRDKA